MEHGPQATSVAGATLVTRCGVKPRRKTHENGEENGAKIEDDFCAELSRRRVLIADHDVLRDGGGHAVLRGGDCSHSQKAFRAMEGREHSEARGSRTCQRIPSGSGARWA